LGSMGRVLGISCSKGGVLLALVGDDGSLSASPDRVKPSALLAEDEALRAMLADLGRIISSARVSRVRLLLPEASVGHKHPDIAPRIAYETLFRLAAFQAGVPVEQLSRSEARRRLGLGTRGEFEKLLTEEIIGLPVGRYWSEGRKLAMAAALADIG